MAQSTVYSGNAAAAYGSKVRNIITLARHAAEIFFVAAKFWPQKGPLGEKNGENLAVTPKKLVILMAWRLFRFFTPKCN